MNPERHRRIGELFDAALKLGYSRRAEFLQHACAGDDELRREVESLLDSHERVDDLLSTPAFEVAAIRFSRCWAGAEWERCTAPKI
jgi:hypothetical protein